MFCLWILKNKNSGRYTCWHCIVFLCFSLLCPGPNLHCLVSFALPIYCLLWKKIFWMSKLFCLIRNVLLERHIYKKTQTCRRKGVIPESAVLLLLQAECEARDCRTAVHSSASLSTKHNPNHSVKILTCSFTQLCHLCKYNMTNKTELNSVLSCSLNNITSHFTTNWSST